MIRPFVAGVVTALVGFTSSFVIVLSGLAAMGATPAQAGSGLLAVSIAMGVACIVLATIYRMPITAAWSTPGAALLVTTGNEGTWSDAVGAFLTVAILVLLTALLPTLGRLIARIPASIAQAMLAGVLLPLCIAPVQSVVDNPWGVIPVIAVWLICTRVAARWAVPAAFVTATVVVVFHVAGGGAAQPALSIVPEFVVTAPTFSAEATVGIALPLFIVTMASQNVPGMAVMKSYGYDVPWRPAMLVTGAATAVAAPFGAHAINLAAISAALAAGEDAGPDRSRRWMAGVSAGITFIVLGLFSTAFSALVGLAPAGVIAAVAGIALLGALGSAAHHALSEPEDRIAAAVTLVVAASGVAIAGVSAAFWALIVGLVVRFVTRSARR